MSELEPTPQNPERDRLAALAEVVEQYFPDDKEFVTELDFEEALGFVYGQLLETGEDPDTVLVEAGVIEKEGDDEV